MLAVSLGLALLAALVSVVGAGPVDYVSAPTVTVTTTPPAPPPSGPTAAATATPTVASLRALDPGMPPWLATVLQVLVALVVGGAAYLVLVVLRRAVSRRRSARPSPDRAPPTDALPLRAEDLARAVSTSRTRLAETGSARNAVVAAWVHLQESVAATGLAAGHAQTPTEYLTDVLATWDVDRRALEELAGLYREARFSDHPILEDHRHRATAALDRIHAELTRAAALSTSAEPVAVAASQGVVR